MNEIAKPHLRPFDPRFSCGPTKKHPGWSLDQLSNAAVGRSHRSALAVSKLREAIDRTMALLEVPEGYRGAILGGSDTGAMEAAIWSLLGERPVDVFAWDTFGARWLKDVRDELKLKDANVYEAKGGLTPDFSKARKNADIVFTWNATAAGAMIPDTDWIPDDREGLTLVDATSAAFALELDWSKIDVLTFSWQKSMGGEAQHGIIILSPRAIERLKSYTPSWPIPRMMQLKNADGLNEGLFEGKTLNTVSLLSTEDYLLSLKWAAKEGGLDALIARTRKNFATLSNWVAATDWIDFLVEDTASRSPVSVTLKFAAPDVTAMSQDDQWAITRKMASLLDRENAALDVAPHVSGVAGLRIWCGPTVEADDLAALGPWLDWAYAEARRGE